MKIFYKKSSDPRVLEFNKLIEDKYPQFLAEESPDLFLVAGGDGALHHATKELDNFNGIFFGKGLGTLNFLMNDFIDDENVLNNLVNDSIALDHIETQAIEVFYNGKRIASAYNDVLFGDSVNSYISFSISAADKSFNNFSLKGSGLNISTPLGSTAFNFNNNGVILPLDCGLWSLTGIVCDKDINDVLTGQLMRIKANKGNLFVDGISMVSFNDLDDVVELRVGKTIKLGFLNKDQFMRKRIELANRHRASA